MAVHQNLLEPLGIRMQLIPENRPDGELSAQLIEAADLAAQSRFKLANSAIEPVYGTSPVQGCPRDVRVVTQHMMGKRMHVRTSCKTMPPQCCSEYKDGIARRLGSAAPTSAVDWLRRGQQELSHHILQRSF
jgi:hypothetical protein